jgi:hypothetical protein
MGAFSDLDVKAVMAFEVCGSGVSSASALSAGEDSAPETSEKRLSSKGLRGVVNEGLRKGGAAVEDEEVKECRGCESKPPVVVSLVDKEVIRKELTVSWVRLRKW